jgi:cyclase
MPKRIIPCLDITDGKVVKGVKFTDLTDIGDPLSKAQEYELQGADEIVFLDITATTGNRKSNLIDTISKARELLKVPITVGGGIRTIEDFRALLNAGASKVAVNSAAIATPNLIADAAKEFGSSAVVVAIDAVTRADGTGWDVVTHGGQQNAGIDLVDWARQVEALGAGEILLTSLDRDGTRDGFDLPQLDAVSRAVAIPVIASGGVGDVSHFREVFENTGVDAALAASLFHYGDATVADVKNDLAIHGIEVRN